MGQWKNGVMSNAMESFLSSASQEIPRILWSPKLHYCTQNCPSPVPTYASCNTTMWRMRHFHFTILHRRLSASVRVTCRQVSSKQNTTLKCNWCPIHDVRLLHYRTLCSWFQSMRVARKSNCHIIMKKYYTERLNDVGGTRLRSQEVSSIKNSIKMSVRIQSIT